MFSFRGLMSSMPHLASTISDKNIDLTNILLLICFHLTSIYRDQQRSYLSKIHWNSNASANHSSLHHLFAPPGHVVRQVFQGGNKRTCLERTTYRKFVCFLKAFHLIMDAWVTKPGNELTFSTHPGTLDLTTNFPNQIGSLDIWTAWNHAPTYMSNVTVI